MLTVFNCSQSNRSFCRTSKIYASCPETQVIWPLMSEDARSTYDKLKKKKEKKIFAAHVVSHDRRVPAQILRILQQGQVFCGRATKAWKIPPVVLVNLDTNWRLVGDSEWLWIGAARPVTLAGSTQPHDRHDLFRMLPQQTQKMQVSY